MAAQNIKYQIYKQNKNRQTLWQKTMVTHINANPFSTGDIEDSDFDVSLVDIPFCKSQDGNKGKFVITQYRN